MSRIKIALALAATFLGFVVLFVGLGVVLVAMELAPAIPLLLILLLFYGWMLFAYLHYRQGRQEEMLHLLSTAAESQAPLAPALWAYLRDRPQGPLREFWVALLLFFVMPGYYWVWHRRNSFDSKVARVAYFLEMGDSLPMALRAAPGVLSREAWFAVQVGQYTNNLAICLRASLPKSLAPIWLEMVPRLLYPLVVMMIMSGILGFYLTFVLPRMHAIFREFAMEMPQITLQLQEVGGNSRLFFAATGTIIWGVVILTCLLFLSSTLRWYMPVFGRLYRRHVQGRLLQMLGVLLNAGTPAPAAIGLLADSGYFAAVVRRRLRRAEERLQQGEPLAESLRRAGVLPAALTPVVSAAQRMHNVPWVLAELGETLIDRTIRSMRRLSQFISPVCVVALGSVVAFVVLGMFMPLITIMTKLAE